jgi:hypothetical protein
MEKIRYRQMVHDTPACPFLALGHIWEQLYRVIFFVPINLQGSSKSTKDFKRCFEDEVFFKENRALLIWYITCPNALLTHEFEKIIHFQG